MSSISSRPSQPLYPSTTTPTTYGQSPLDRLFLSLCASGNYSGVRYLLGPPRLSLGRVSTIASHPSIQAALQLDAKARLDHTVRALRALRANRRLLGDSVTPQNAIRVLVAQYLLREYVLPTVVDAGPESPGDSALHVATRGGHVRIVRLLVDSGADVGHVNRDGRTPWDVCPPPLRGTLAEILDKRTPPRLPTTTTVVASALEGVPQDFYGVSLARILTDSSSSFSSSASSSSCSLHDSEEELMGADVSGVPSIDINRVYYEALAGNLPYVASTVFPPTATLTALQRLSVSFADTLCLLLARLATHPLAPHTLFPPTRENSRKWIKRMLLPLRPALGADVPSLIEYTLSLSLSSSSSSSSSSTSSNHNNTSGVDVEGTYASLLDMARRIQRLRTHPHLAAVHLAPRGAPYTLYTKAPKSVLGGTVVHQTVLDVALTHHIPSIVDGVLDSGALHALVPGFVSSTLHAIALVLSTTTGNHSSTSTSNSNSNHNNNSTGKENKEEKKASAALLARVLDHIASTCCSFRGVLYREDTSGAWAAWEAQVRQYVLMLSDKVKRKAATSSPSYRVALGHRVHMLSAVWGAAGDDFVLESPFYLANPSTSIHSNSTSNSNNNDGGLMGGDGDKARNVALVLVRMSAALHDPQLQDDKSHVVGYSGANKLRKAMEAVVRQYVHGSSPSGASLGSSGVTGILLL